MGIAELMWNVGKFLFTTFLMPVVTGVAIMALEKKPIKPMFKAIVMYPVFMGSWILINIKCLIKPNTKWEKIEHVRDINIQEVKSVTN